MATADTSHRCPHCAKQLHAEPEDGTSNTTELSCLNCGYRETVRNTFNRITRREVRTLIRQSRRLLLGPSCYGRLHPKCTATNCECPCHNRTRKGA